MSERTDEGIFSRLSSSVLSGLLLLMLDDVELVKVFSDVLSSSVDRKFFTFSFDLTTIN